MDLHKPKPWHGLREFLKEYLIIVVGVLTALAAEQGVEWLHWRHEAHLAREAIAFDLKRIIGEAAAKDAVAPCVAKKFAEYADALEAAGTTRRLPAIAWGGDMGSNGWSLRSWYGLTSGQTLAHMSNRDQIALSALAGYLEYARSLRTEESANVGVLTTILGPSRPVSEAEIAGLKAALGRASQNEATQRNLGRQLETMILRSGFLGMAEAQAAYREGIQAAQRSRICTGRSVSVAHFRDWIVRGLDDPPKALGAANVSGLGVSGALTTEH